MIAKNACHCLDRTVKLIIIPRLHDRANIELARRAMIIGVLIKRAGGL